MTLAEAIVQTAFNSQTGIGLATIQSAVDLALVGDPSVLMNLVSGPRGISGVGDAGDSNFANEPHLPGPPPVKPVAPPVSSVGAAASQPVSEYASKRVKTAPKRETGG